MGAVVQKEEEEEEQEMGVWEDRIWGEGCLGKKKTREWGYKKIWVLYEGG